MEPEILCANLQSLTIYARYLAGNRDYADELMQDVAVQVLGNLDKINDITHPKAYLKTMLYNRFLDQCRKQARLPPQIGIEDGEIEDTRKDCSLELTETHAAIALLPTEHRKILLLRVHDDMTYEGLAEHLCLPLGTVMSRLNRARAQLRQAVGR